MYIRRSKNDWLSSLQNRPFNIHSNNIPPKPQDIRHRATRKRSDYGKIFCAGLAMLPSRKAPAKLRRDFVEKTIV
jgi:hypothetical protein